MNFGEKIKQLRLEKNWTQEFVANKLNISMGAVSRYETGMYEPKSLDLVKDFSNLFEVSTDYLLGKSEFKTNQQEMDDFMSKNTSILILKTIDRYYYEYVIPCSLKEEDINKLVSLLSNIKDKETSKKAIDEYLNKFEDNNIKKKVNELIDIILKEIIDSIYEKGTYYYLASKIKSTQNSNFYMCPVYGQISAGQPNWAEECIEGRLMLDPDLMGIVNPEEHFFLRVNGESMNQVVRNGAFALIHKQDTVESGEIAVVLVNGYDATLKKFTRQGELIILEPQSNDESFKTQVYDKTTPIKILGKYVGKMEINK